MDRTQLLRKMDASWDRLIAALHGIPDPLLMAPATLGDWSLTDLMGHIATWDEETMRWLAATLEGKRARGQGSINAFNAREVERKRQMSAAEMRGHLMETHGRLRRFVESVPEERYAREGPFRRQLRVDTTSHYAEHTVQVLTWRQTLHSSLGQSQRTT